MKRLAYPEERRIRLELPPGEFKTHVEFYCLEAESWLAKAK